MKKLLFALLSVTAIVSVALAKDGPFPIESAVGSWVSQNVPGLTVTIDLGDRDSNVAIVSVRIYNANGVLVARGAGYHRLDSDKLHLKMADTHGVPLEIIMKAVADDGKVIGRDGPFPAHFHLLLNIENYGNFFNGVKKMIILGRKN